MAAEGSNGDIMEDQLKSVKVERVRYHLRNEEGMGRVETTKNGVSVLSQSE